MHSSHTRGAARRGGGILDCRAAAACLLIALAIPCPVQCWRAHAGVIVSIGEALNDALAQPDVDRDLQAIVASTFKSGRYAEATKQLLSLKTKHAGDSRVWFALAVAQLGDRRFADALASAERCIQIRPEWAAAYWLKGAVQVAQANLDLAEKTFDEAVRISPEHPGVYYQRGAFRVVYQDSDPQKLTGGIADLQKALALKAPTETVDAMLGKAYLKQRNYSVAEQHLRRAVEHGTTELNLEPLADLVALYDTTGQTNRADAVLSEADKRRRTLPADETELNAGYYLIVARHAIAARRAATQIGAAFERALTLTPRNSIYRLEYARWLDGIERTSEEISVLRQGLSSPPFDSELAAQLAWALAESGQSLDEARRWLGQALASDPSSPYLADTAAWIEYRAKNYRAAWTAIQPGLRIIDEIPEAAYHAGAIQAELGNKAEAIRYLRIALKSGNSFPGGRRAQELLSTLQR